MSPLVEELCVSPLVEELCVSPLVEELSVSPLVEEQTRPWIPSSWMLTFRGQSGRVM